MASALPRRGLALGAPRFPLAFRVDLPFPHHTCAQCSIFTFSAVRPCSLAWVGRLSLRLYSAVLKSKV